MAKFAVGEIAVLVPNEYSMGGMLGEHVKITALNPPGNWADKNGFCPADYEILHADGKRRGALESELRKLPPDATHRDTTEDPGLTRLKKLLQQDKVKRKETA